MARRWVSKIAIALVTALLFIGVLMGGAWLSTHQSSLQGMMPVVAVIGLAAMVYGARKK